jgi:Putative zinc-finger
MTPSREELSHEDAKARLVAHVYGEGAPVERAAIDAHVASCARCQAELAALGETRAQVRAALDDGPVPARAHARILEAARAAVAPAAPAVAAPGAEERARVAAPPARRGSASTSFWERVRGKWTLPTLATAGAVALMLVGSKVLLDPQRAIDRRQEALAPSEAVPAAAARNLAPAAAPGAAPAEDNSAAPPPEAPRVEGGKRTLSPAAQAAIERSRGTFGGRRDGFMGQFGTPNLGPHLGAVASRAIANARPLAAAPAAGEAGLGSATGAARGGAAAPAKDDLARGAPAKSAPLAPTKREVQRTASAEADSAFARPPAGWKGHAASSPKHEAKRDDDSPLEAPASAGADRRKEVADEGAVAARAEPAPVALAKKKKATRAPTTESSAGALEEAEAGNAGAAASAPAAAPVAQADKPVVAKVAAQPAAPPASPSKDDASSAPDYAAAARRADQLYAARRWPAAVAAYRELLRRWPGADAAKRWRARLAEAQGEAATRAAPAAAPAEAN